ncbi:MAG: tRNA lysidine(34) synthetase TilS [bacterium]
MIKQKVIETIKEYSLLNLGETVLVAVSGGTDSTALINLLAEIKNEFRLKLHIAHLNHLIRKGDAELDVKYVEGLAEKLNIPITVESFDVAGFAKQSSLGLEAAARQIRYAFFAKVAKQIKADKIAVGHTADDNVETFLMRLLRGAGIKGLCGIPPQRDQIIRPLIKTWRREIEDYVGSRKLVPRRDFTNYESRFYRNRVRMKLIPQLKLYNLNIKEIILQTILLLTGDNEYLTKMTEEALLNTLSAKDDNEVRLNLSKFRACELPIQGHLIRRAIELIKGNLLDLTFDHVQQILDKLAETERWELHLPGGIFVLGNRRELSFLKERPAQINNAAFKYQLPIPGEVEIKEIGKTLRAEIVEKNAVIDQPNLAFVDYGAIGKTVYVRSRQAGDRFSPLGLKGFKKLQDFFVDEKIPSELRDTIPLVESAGQIVWVGGLRIDERSKITKRTNKVLKLELL